jgi:hypothetical protein
MSPSPTGTAGLTGQPTSQVRYNKTGTKYLASRINLPHRYSRPHRSTYCAGRPGITGLASRQPEPHRHSWAHRSTYLTGITGITGLDPHQPVPQVQLASQFNLPHSSTSRTGVTGISVLVSHQPIPPVQLVNLLHRYSRPHRSTLHTPFTVTRQPISYVLLLSQGTSLTGQPNSQMQLVVGKLPNRSKIHKADLTGQLT